MEAFAEPWAMLVIERIDTSTMQNTIQRPIEAFRPGTLSSSDGLRLGHQVQAFGSEYDMCATLLA